MIDRKLIRKIIFESIETEIDKNLGIHDKSDATRNSPTSVDDQIDSFLIRYEKDSEMAPEDSEMAEVEALAESLKHMSLLGLLTEQEEEDDDVEDLLGGEEEVEEEGGEEGGEEEKEEGEVEVEEEEPTGSEEQSDVAAAAAEDMPMPKLDIDKFTAKVIRLYENPTVLLSVPDVIINRAKNYLLENYGEKHAQRFIDNLKTNFSLDFETGEDIERIPDAPFSVGANPAGAGMGGGA